MFRRASAGRRRQGRRHDSQPASRASRILFDTQVRGPFGKGAPTIAEALERAEYRRLAEPTGFVVKGQHGPLRDGELERAREWGAELARLMAGART